MSISRKTLATVVAFVTASITGCYSIPTRELTPSISASGKSAKCTTTTDDVAASVSAAPMVASAFRRTPAGEPSNMTVALLVPALLQSGASSPSTSDQPTESSRMVANTVTTNVLVHVPGRDDAAINAERDQALSQAQLEANSLARSLSVNAASVRLANLKSESPDELKNDKVFTYLAQTVQTVATHAQIKIASKAALSSGYVPPNDVTPPSQNLSNGDFKNFAYTVRTLLSSPEIAIGGAQTDHPVVSAANTGDTVTFKNAFVSYFSAYYAGNFVDRFGTKLAKPKLSLTISDTEIGDVVQIMWELIYDYALRTPVWSDGTLYYPGSSKDEPTAAAVKLIKPQTILAKNLSAHCGMTELKLEAVQYLANAASDRASTLGGMVTSSFGGFEIGLGFLGKFSFGDNQTLQTVVKVSIGQAAQRAAEEASYRALYWIPYNQDSILADLVQQYLDGKGN
jgi:hypothetical protein